MLHDPRGIKQLPAPETASPVQQLPPPPGLHPERAPVPTHTAHANEMMAMRILARQLQNGVVAAFFQQCVWNAATMDKARAAHRPEATLPETLYKPTSTARAAQFIHDNAVREWDVVYAVREGRVPGNPAPSSANASP